MDALDWFRVANIVLATGLAFVCSVRLTRDWPVWTRREQVVRVHLLAYLLVIAYGTSEQLAQDVPPGLRVLLVCAINVSLALGLWRHRNDPPIS